MAEIRFNSTYLTSHRGIAKIVQIILGFFICSVLCANWYGGSSCFGEGRLGYVSGLNFAMLVVNIVIFLLNLMNLHLGKFEYFFNVLSTVLFVIAIALFLWWTIEYGAWGIWRIITMIALAIMVFLYSWDTNLARQHHSDHLPI
ncbi:hypothetical protein M3Y96_00773400 [Aphelenchoides besseyi]|nr:hypothetical protein M3Y96_00773400 [Aphelenchoides besseyi]